MWAEIPQFYEARSRIFHEYVIVKWEKYHVSEISWIEKSTNLFSIIFMNIIFYRLLTTSFKYFEILI